MIRTTLFLSVALSCFSVYGAETSLQPLLQQCAAMSDDALRLSCYDELASRALKGSPVAAVPSPEAHPLPDTKPTADVRVADDLAVAQPPAPAPLPAPTAEEKFGLEHKQAVAESAPDSLTLRVTKKKKNAYGKWQLTLENGQVWKQTDSTRYNFSNKDGLVVITRGSMGSFFIGEPDRNKRIRAKRVK